LTPHGAITVVLRTASPWSPTAVAFSESGLYVLEYVHTAEEDRQAWAPRVRKLLPNGSIVNIAVQRPNARRGVMADPPVTIVPDETVRKAAALMTSHGIGSLPVIDEGKLVGIVTTSDLLALIAKGTVHRA
jgi:CBS-domain-containing membrane protein